MLSSFAQAVSRTLPLDQVNTLADMLADQPKGFGATCADRAAWTSPEVAERTKQIQKSAEKLLEQDFPAWDDALYLEYSRKGTRPKGEEMMNARKAWLYPLTIAECVEGKGRFLPAIERTLTELSEQPTWTWPAHDKALRNFKDKNYEVDLMAADTAHDIAQALYMLGDAIRPELRSKTLDALEARIFAPLRKSFATGDKDNFWLHVDHNWNAVCLKGSVGAALTVLPDKKDRALFAAAGAHYIQTYVAGFAPDGYATEGAGYWNYGFSHFAVLRELLLQATGGKVDLFLDAKTRNIALYGYRIEMFPDNVAAFGDASPRTRMDRQTRAYVNDVLSLGQRQHFDKVALEERRLSNEAPLVNAALLLFTQPVALSKKAHDESIDIGLRSYFDSVGVLVSRPASGGKLAVSIKAGGNKNHSHNDVGSYVIALGAEQPTGDVGRPQYTAKTFSKSRYTIGAINSWGHPVPVVAGQLQVQADKIKPRVISTRFSDEADEITLNMADAYNVSSLRVLTRTLTHERQGAGAVTVTDRFEFSRDNRFEVALTTQGQWKQNADGTIELWQKNERLIAHIEASAPWELKAETPNEEGLLFTRLGICLTEEQKSGFITVRFEPIAP